MVRVKEVGNAQNGETANPETRNVEGRKMLLFARLDFSEVLPGGGIAARQSRGSQYSVTQRARNIANASAARRPDMYDRRATP